MAGTSELKVDHSIFKSQITIEDYNLIWEERNERGVAFYIN